MLLFWRQGISSLRKEITWVLIVKIALIYLLCWIFSPHHPVKHPSLREHLLQTKDHHDTP